ncbi:MAG TPA: glycerate kinase [Polyangiaceae bacterium]
MKILIAPNAFKGSLDAFEVADAIAEGLAKGLARADMILMPIADGGDGTLAVLLAALGGEALQNEVIGPLGRPVIAQWGLAGDRATAIVEMARASGLALLRAEERDPMMATSYGAGQLVGAALDRGCRRIVVALGGSASVDGGAGLAEALGARLLDGSGTPIGRGGGALAALEHIDVAGLDGRLANAEIIALCDVDSPLLGPEGAARRFAPQKGATDAMVEALESNLTRLAEVIARDLGRDIRNAEHAGAAGGVAAGIAGILGGRLVRGIDFVLECLRFDERLEGCDWVVTAEGSLDRQTLGNKGPYGVARAAQGRGIPVLALTGALPDDFNREDFSIFQAILSICPRPMTLDEALGRTRQRLAATAEEVGRLLLLPRPK